MNKEKIRELFYNLDNVNHLAACSKSPMLKTVKFSMENYAEDVIELGNPWNLWTEKVEKARELFAQLIHADKKDIAALYSVSSALNSIMSSMEFSNRNEIVTSDMEFPTTNFALHGYSKYGAEIKTIKSNDNAIDIDNYNGAINKKTLMTTAIHVSSLNGFRQDVGKIASIAHENGSYIYVDDYQSLGGVNIDVKKSKIDFLASGNLKWLLGVSGVAFLYVNPEIVETLKPANIGWFSQKNPFEFGAEWDEREQYDLMGVIFEGHENLRRILLPEEWVGHPLRKDYDLKKVQYVSMDKSGAEHVSFDEKEGW